LRKGIQEYRKIGKEKEVRGQILGIISEGPGRHMSKIVNVIAS
jgi:hypothetical protein